MKRSAAVESGRLALSLPATDLLASDIAGELEMSRMRAMEMLRLALTFAPRRLALSLPATDLLASDIAGELEMSRMRAAAGEPTIADPPARFFRFDHHRRWHFDFAWPAQRIAAEVEPGATIVRSAALYRNELEKYNAAAFHGWRVFRFTPRDVKEGRAMEMLRLALTFAPTYVPNRNQETHADGTHAGTTSDCPARPPLPVDH